MFICRQKQNQWMIARLQNDLELTYGLERFLRKQTFGTQIKSSRLGWSYFVIHLAGDSTSGSSCCGWYEKTNVDDNIGLVYVIRWCACRCHHLAYESGNFENLTQWASPSKHGHKKTLLLAVITGKKKKLFFTLWTFWYSNFQIS